MLGYYPRGIFWFFDSQIDNMRTLQDSYLFVWPSQYTYGELKTRESSFCFLSRFQIHPWKWHFFSSLLLHKRRNCFYKASHRFKLKNWSLSLKHHHHRHHHQEPIARSLQLPHVPVTAFSRNDLFLVWIYLEFRSPQELQCPIAITSTD